ncbi:MULTISPECIES: hypothetical protein [unclassified Tolypothrix]|nr:MULTISPECIES: hypothetical protein [unclassified Tolypothrix]EKF04970.1 hypothetical protein FDUTEX481_01134 [Tolypothrix sp. PCC 7601]
MTIYLTYVLLHITAIAQQLEIRLDISPLYSQFLVFALLNSFL